MIYSITVYPNGTDQSQVELHFNDQQHKETYIKQEATYCRKEYSQYIGEMFDSKERHKLKQAFHKKRIEFAKKNNFEPVNANVWKQKFHNNSPDIA